MRNNVFIILFVFMFISLSTQAFAMPGIGARAMGMGGAYTALARDITSAYWNPAGLIKAGLLIGDGMVSAGYDGNMTISDLQALSNMEKFVEDNMDNEIDWNIGASGIAGASIRGIGVSAMSFTDGLFFKSVAPTGYSPKIDGSVLMNNSVNLTFGTNVNSFVPLAAPVALGVNVRSVTGIYKTFTHAGALGGAAPVDMIDATGSGMGLDLGLQADVAPMITLGIAFRDLMTGMTLTGDTKSYTGIDPTTGEPTGPETITDFEMVQRGPTHSVMGVAAQIPMLATLAADVDMYDVVDVGTKMDFHFGAESGIPLGFLTPRAGYYTENGGEKAKITLGLGMGIGPVGANVAYGWDTEDASQTLLVVEIGGAL